MLFVKSALRDLEAKLPDGMRARLLIERRLRHWHRAGIIFVHVPKAAGTSVNLALYGRFMGHVKAVHIKRMAPRTFHELPSFAIVRNPWSRLISSYRFVKANSSQSNPTLVAGVHNPKQYDIPAFRGFESFVEEWLVHQPLDSLDYVFRPQLPFVADENGNILVSHLGRIECLKATEEFVEEITGREISFGQHNRTGLAADYKSYYTPKLVGLVKHLYRRDVEAFDYEF